MKSSMDDFFFKFHASPKFWRDKARELKFASDNLFPIAMKFQNGIAKQIEETGDLDFDKLKPNVFTIFLALAGYSTECLFKATIIRDNPSYVSNGSLSKELTNHDLIKLAKMGKIKLSHHEEIFCKQAMKAIGEFRYPVQKKITKPNTVHEIGGNCKVVFEALFNRLFSTIDHLIISGDKPKTTRVIRLKVNGEVTQF